MIAGTFKWPTKRLGELAEFRNGVNYNKSSFGEGVKVVGVSDFQDYTKPRYTELEQINPEGIVTERNILRDGDIVFVRSNGNRELIGRSLFIEQPPEEITHSAFTIRLRFTSNEVHPKFYAYCFRTPLVRQGLTAQGGGTNINNLNQDILNALEVPLPPLPVQRRIAGILSAYDELMENSQRRIQLLEAMARALYREWFVHFRFPGHEKVKMVRRPSCHGEASAKTDGDIPKGWEVKKLGDVLELNYGKALKKEDRRDGAFPVYGSSGMVGTHDASLVKGPGVIVGRKGNVGSVFWCDDDFFVIDTAYFVTSSLPLRFLFYVLPTLNFLNSDAAVPGLSRNQAYTLDILVPPAALLKRFCALADSFERQASALQRQIQNVRRTRDLLLPRLLSGQVNLKEN
jgi:type I restriction enzyme S subunit